jgi:hypothetical protein
MSAEITAKVRKMEGLKISRNGEEKAGAATLNQGRF